MLDEMCVIEVTTVRAYMWVSTLECNDIVCIFKAPPLPIFLLIDLTRQLHCPSHQPVTDCSRKGDGAHTLESYRSKTGESHLPSLDYDIGSL